jgi:hypothetical protein
VATAGRPRLDLRDEQFSQPVRCGRRERLVEGKQRGPARAGPSTFWELGVGTWKLTGRVETCPVGENAVRHGVVRHESILLFREGALPVLPSSSVAPVALRDSCHVGEQRCRVTSSASVMDETAEAARPKAPSAVQGRVEIVELAERFAEVSVMPRSMRESPPGWKFPIPNATPSSDPLVMPGGTRRRARRDGYQHTEPRSSNRRTRYRRAGRRRVDLRCGEAHSPPHGPVPTVRTSA